MTDSGISFGSPSERLLIVGLGLLGGSVGLAAKKYCGFGEIVGLVRPSARAKSTCDEALTLNVVDRCLVEGEHEIPTCDFVVICTPIDDIPKYVELVLPRLSATGVVTDVGSTKTTVVREAEKGMQKAGRHGFVGSHPMAGGEKKGLAHSSADLFVDKPIPLTPTLQTDAAALERVRAFWTALRGNVLEFSPEEHDRITASVSHMPHLVASALALSFWEKGAACAGAGLKDTTRIAGGDPELWKQIFLDNATNVLQSLSEFERNIAAFRHAVETKNASELKGLLQQGKDRRDALGN